MYVERSFLLREVVGKRTFHHFMDHPESNCNPPELIKPLELTYEHHMRLNTCLHLFSLVICERQALRSASRDTNKMVLQRSVNLNKERHESKSPEVSRWLLNFWLAVKFGKENNFGSLRSPYQIKIHQNKQYYVYIHNIMAIPCNQYFCKDQTIKLKMTANILGTIWEAADGVNNIIIVTSHQSRQPTRHILHIYSALQVA